MKRIEITDNMLDRFIAGDATREEIVSVVAAMRTDPALREKVAILHEMEEADAYGIEVPLERMAADDGDNLCEAMCERRILRDYLPAAAYAGILHGPGDNRWLTPDGVPLHAVGRGLAMFGMSVTRRFDATEDDIRSSLARHVRLIAVVDGGALYGSSSGRLHAVVPLRMDTLSIRLYDPARHGDVDVDPHRFLTAWGASRRYLVLASAGRLPYEPHPVPTDDVTLGDEILSLADLLAEDAHESAAASLFDAGWRHGAALDAAARLRPDLVPYADLPEADREALREGALHTLRLMRKLGYRVSRPGTFTCPDCGGFVEPDHLYCPRCGRRLSWRDFDLFFDADEEQ